MHVAAARRWISRPLYRSGSWIHRTKPPSGWFTRVPAGKVRNTSSRVASTDIPTSETEQLSVDLSHGAPWRSRVDRRFPALSSFRGHRPTHETKCPAVGNRLI